MKYHFRLFIFLLAFWANSGFADARSLIAVVKTRDAEPYGTAIKSLRRTLQANGIEARIEEFRLPEHERALDHPLVEIKKRNPQLIVTLGSAATAQTAKAIKDTPVLFCMALNPLASGFIRSMHSSGNNLTGASLDIPAQVQFSALRTVLPNTKKIGVIYNPQETERVVQQARNAARQMGLELVTVAVSSGDEVPAALRKLENTVDALWSVADGTTFSLASMEFFFLYTLRNKIPFMGLSPAFVKAGALLALAIDYDAVGAQCGGLATKLLAGEAPSALPVTTPEKTILHVNLNTAGALGIKIPAERLKNAVIVR